MTISSPTAEGRVLPTAELVPATWRALLEAGPVRAFNPALLRDGNSWLTAYRLVGADGQRRIGLARLTTQWEIVADSPLPLTDFVRFADPSRYPAVATSWFADPRLYRLGERVFLYWNSGWHEPKNHQFLQELEPRTFRPLGPAREMVLRGERQRLEKNWTLFLTPRGEMRAVYSIVPHRVMAFSLAGEGDIVFEPIATEEWTATRYPPHHGGLRGGAPAVLAEGEFWSFCHAVHDGEDGYRYAAAVYAFAADAPFAPTRAPIAPLRLFNPNGGIRTYPRLNPAVGEVIYPCGAARDGARWVISHGLNDEHCAITTLAHAEVVAATERWSRERPAGSDAS